jgi:Helix-turn-helix domain
MENSMPRVAVLHESWLTHSDVSADEIAVLAVLALHTNKNGACWPTQGLLARLLGRSRPWVNKVIGKLVELGIVVRTHRTRDDGGDRACLYSLVGPVEPRQAQDSDVSAGDTRSHADDSVKGSSEQTKGTHTARPALDQRIVHLDLTMPEPDWQPSDADLCWAMDRYPTVDLSASVERFVLRCRAKGYRYCDLGAAWKSWLTDDQREGGRFREAKQDPGGGRGSAAKAKFDAWAGVAAKAGSARHAA